MRRLYFLGGVAAVFLLLSSCPSGGSLLSYEEKLERVVYWAAEFGYNCALANVSREEMHRLLEERKES